MQGAAVAVAMMGLVVIALWLAGAPAPGGPARTGAAGGSGAVATTSPTTSPTEVVQATSALAGRTPVIPAVPCNTRTPPPSLGATLTVGGGQTYAGSTASSMPPPDVAASPRDRLLLVLGAEDCAVAWDVKVTAESLATPVFEDVLLNPDLSPIHGMQNRWEVTSLPPGDYLLSAHLTTLDGRSLVARWRLQVEGIPAGVAPTAVP